eukprot:scaffold4714_cov185-Ochromonas_danica.AAC.5
MVAVCGRVEKRGLILLIHPTLTKGERIEKLKDSRKPGKVVQKERGGLQMKFHYLLTVKDFNEILERTLSHVDLLGSVRREKERRCHIIRTFSYYQKTRRYSTRGWEEEE